MALQITRVNTPDYLYPYKCPYGMVPTSLTIHETGNFATAMSEISYMLSNTNYVSYHLAVDDERAVQGLPLNRIGYHSGDGSGPGNMRSIGIETCFNYRNGQLTNHDSTYNAKYLKARTNVIELAAQLHVQYGWGIPCKGVTLFRHYDRNGKNCPQRIIADGYWDTFCSEVAKRYNQIKNNKGESLLEGLKSISNKKQDIITGSFNKNSGGLAKLEKYLKDHKWSYKRIVKGNNVTLKVGWFRVDNPGKFALEKFLAMNDWVYEVRFH